MLHPGQDVAFRCTIPPELIGDDHARHILESFKEFAKASLGSLFVAAALHQDIQHVPLLIHLCWLLRISVPNGGLLVSLPVPFPCHLHMKQVARTFLLRGFFSDCRTDIRSSQHRQKTVHFRGSEKSEKITARQGHA